jgi:hypothetical protein
MATFDFSLLVDAMLRALPGYQERKCPACGEKIISIDMDKRGNSKMIDYRFLLHAESCTGPRNKNRRYGT